MYDTDVIKYVVIGYSSVGAQVSEAERVAEDYGVWCQGQPTSGLPVVENSGAQRDVRMLAPSVALVQIDQLSKSWA